MIQLTDITIRANQQHLLLNTTLTINNGDKVVIRGPSGSGKSSLLKSLVGAIPLGAGTVVIEGKVLSPATVSDIRSRIAFIGQEPVLGATTVRDALLLPFQYKSHKGSTPDFQTIDTLLKRLNLRSDILSQPCNRISGGEKQRVAIVRALLLGKSIFLADEVTSALDPVSREAVMHELFRPHITLVSVSHDPEWIDACDRIIDLTDQKLMETEP